MYWKALDWLSQVASSREPQILKHENRQNEMGDFISSREWDELQFNIISTFNFNTTQEVIKIKAAKRRVNIFFLRTIFMPGVGRFLLFIL